MKLDDEYDLEEPEDEFGSDKELEQLFEQMEQLEKRMMKMPRRLPATTVRPTTPVRSGNGGHVTLPSEGFYITIIGEQQGEFRAETKAKGQSRKIRGLKFHYASSVPYDSATGQVTGKSQHQPLAITKHRDAATLQSLSALDTNELLTAVRLEFYRMAASGSGELFQTIHLTNAHIVRVELYSGKLGHLEDVAFVFEKLEIENKSSNQTAETSWR